MENIFKKITIPRYFFNIYLNLKPNLHNYIFDNLQKEKNRFRCDLQNAFRNKANGKYD
jgi:hypothetical protein